MSEKPSNTLLANEIDISLGSYLRVIWVNKILMVLTGFAFLCMFGAIGVALSLLPLKSTEIKYVEFSSSGNNFVTVASAGEGIKSNQYVVKAVRD